MALSSWQLSLAMAPLLLRYESVNAMIELTDYAVTTRCHNDALLLERLTWR